MDKKILLDTNIIYLLSGIEKNKYDLNKIKELCNNSECLVNLYSIFEIYNNTHITLDQIGNILKMLQKKNIKICCNDTMRSTFEDSLNLSHNTQANRVIVRNKLSKAIIPVYSRLFSFLSTINYFIAFLFKENPEEGYYQKLSAFIGKLLPTIDNHVRLVMEKNLSSNLFFEKNLKNLYACLLSSFQFTILNFEERRKKLNKDFVETEVYFELLLKEFKKEDFMNCCMRFVMEGSHNQKEPILPNMYKLIFKPRFPTKEDAECFFNDIVCAIFVQSDSIEKEWFKYMLKNLLYDDANLKTNNFMDYLIIRDFTLAKDIDYLITCDGQMQKIMELLSFNTKIEESINISKSLM